jgi:hypothetical protein
MGKYIIKLQFNDNQHVAHGPGFLIDYEHHKLYQLIYRRGKLIEKILHLDRQDNDDAFSQNNLTKLIGVKHEQSF